MEQLERKDFIYPDWILRLSPPETAYGGLVEWVEV